MPTLTFSTPVNATFSTLWGLLLDKVENPQRYIAEVEESQVLEKYDNSILREIKVLGTLLRERISIDEAARAITFTLVEHLLFSGETLNQVESSEKSGEPLILTFTQNWQPLNEKAEKITPEQRNAAIEKAVLKMKELAEQQGED